MIRHMGKKAKLRTKHTVETPVEGELATEAAYYARKVGITVHEAAKLIREAQGPQLSIIKKDKAR